MKAKPARATLRHSSESRVGEPGQGKITCRAGIAGKEGQLGQIRAPERQERQFIKPSTKAAVRETGECDRYDAQRSSPAACCIERSPRHGGSWVPRIGRMDI